MKLKDYVEQRYGHFREYLKTTGIDPERFSWDAWAYFTLIKMYEQYEKDDEFAGKLRSIPSEVLENILKQRAEQQSKIVKPTGGQVDAVAKH